MRAAGEGPALEELEVLSRGEAILVARVREPALERIAVLKTVLPALAGSDRALARLAEEARVTASLLHPGVPCVLRSGLLDDGRPFFTMQEVRGRTLAAAIAAAHAGREPDPAELLGLLSAFRAACEVVAYAHTRGVVHRDLKPANIMMGEFGEVFVLDWGFAYDTARPPEPEEGVTGSLLYLAPERLRPTDAPPAPAVDVYALGVTLYELLSGAPPYPEPDAVGLLDAMRRAPPPPRIRLPQSSALFEVCRRALSREPERRYPDGAALAAAVGAWMEGEQRHELARQRLQQADAARPESFRLRRRAARLRAEARERLEALELSAPVSEKRDAWEMEDEAARMELEASLKELEFLQLLRAAQIAAPDLEDVHRRLADEYRRRHAEAEAAGELGKAAELEILLSHHDRGWHASYLDGMAALTVVTERDGVPVTLYTYTHHDRRLIPAEPMELGRTPLYDLEIPRGSHLLVLRPPDGPEVHYPVCLGREEHWDLVPPGGSAPAPIALPGPGELEADDVYVPAGWFWCGGDPLAAGKPLARQRLWLEGFVIKRFPVTNREYIAFLDDLVARGREADALRCAPRERAGSLGEQTPLIYGRDAQGRFVLRPDADGDVWEPDWPVVMVDWHCAKAYADWYTSRSSERTGQPGRRTAWRLPYELEWEKAARGVDGRFFPWGDFLDPTWCCMRDSHGGRPLLYPVDSFPMDESPYGVRGLAGNAHDWCQDLFRADGPPVRDARPVLGGPGDEHFRVVRGGTWTSSEGKCRSAYRSNGDPDVRSALAGFRLARSFTAG